VVPQPQIDEQLHVMLSTVHETVIQRGASFNLGISKFPGNYSPRGHKYLEDFDTEPIPKLTYRVGGVLLQKELILDTNRDRVMIKYTLLEAHSPTTIRISPFLAFRGYHNLSKENNRINKEFEKATGNLISDYFEFKDEEMRQFLKMKKHVFILDDKGYAKAREDFDESSQNNDSNLNRRK
jgi:hypothetical protein